MFPPESSRPPASPEPWFVNRSKRQVQAPPNVARQSLHTFPAAPQRIFAVINLFFFPVRVFFTCF
jgi:hypothetical protein